ncbi:putative amidoligase enzyme-domain-containing protein [Hypoxylon sp. FL1857]|nr:putative amidoligase enzyme-domain-containing protein [Hypoxylon sp. FL1857]
MANEQYTNTGKLSFGVEMEFYICWARRGTEGSAPVPEPFKSHPGGPISTVPVALQTYAAENLDTRIRQFVQGLPAPATVVPSTQIQMNDVDPNLEHLRYYQEWQVVSDMSLVPLHGDLVSQRGRDWGWTGVEVISPALWATDENFNHVRKVCEFIRNTFWTSTHRSAGLHVHVGNGKDYFPIPSLTRLAAFLYAADPILAQCHPEHRHMNGYCSSIRLGSMIASQDATDSEPDPAELEQGSEPTPPQWFDISSFFQNLFTCTPKPPVNMRNKEEREEDRFPPRPRKAVYDLPRGRISLLDAVRALLRQTDRVQIANLMFTDLFGSSCVFPDPDMEMKRTIEFRRAASSVDAAEVVSQARFAVSLCEFAINSTQEDFKKTILDFDTSDDHPTWFDVYDLLIELGLRPEARVIYAALTGTMTDAIRTRYWSSR